MYGKELEKFRKILSRLGPVERTLPIVKINGKFFSWEDIHKSLVKSDKNAKRALDKLKKMGLI